MQNVYLTLYSSFKVTGPRVPNVIIIKPRKGVLQDLALGSRATCCEYLPGAMLLLVFGPLEM